mmetsp:Transcript_44/g.78  ORF Transcript_44/g.78 Transcript_44/m.78 type:complete len:246 (+) Transcript_44:1-738(+)
MKKYILISCCIIIFGLLITKTLGFSIEACVPNEKRLGKYYKDFNSFGHERATMQKTVRLALEQEGFSSTQINRYLGMKKSIIEEYEDDAAEKYCKVLMKDYVKNCVNQYKSMMKHKKGKGITLAMKRMVRGKHVPIPLKKRLYHIAETRQDWERICNLLADNWYDGKHDVYKNPMDEDEEKSYHAYPKLPLSKQKLYKLTNNQLRQIADDRGMKCGGCRTKQDHVLLVEQIQNMAPIKNHQHQDL